MGSKKKKEKTSDGGDSSGKVNKKVIDDPRFSKVHYDPRFQNVPKHKSKFTIDSRFSSIFTDKKFATSSSARVDKRGKVKVQSENDLRRHYHIDEDDDDKEKAKKLNKLSKKDKIDDDDNESSESASEDLSESSDDNDNDNDNDTDTDDDVDGAELSDDDASVEVENVPLIEKETHRLAVVNMDWSQVKAVDLFVMLSSCLPKGGQIKSVSVYPSEFGLKRMEEEAVRGPVALFEDEKKKNEGDNDDDDDDSDKDGDDEDADEVSDNEEDVDEVSDNEDAVEISDNEDVDEDDEHEGSDSQDEYGDGLEDNSDEEYEDEEDDDGDDDEIDNEKLRAYEKSRLRYYYAVVECDSIATADYLYKACDGIEFERSSNVMDLRFIPDSMEFKHQPRDVATEAPAGYEGLDFHTRALQQTNTVLSWDDDEPHRVKTLRRNFTEKQLAEMELNEFLASDESESDEDGNEDPSERKKKKAEKYRALVQSGDGSEEEDEGQNMEVTFATGLEDISKKIIEKKEKGSETVFEAYLRKKKEKKIARKNKSKTSSDDDSDKSDDQEHGEDPDDFFEETPIVKKGKKDRQSRKKEEKMALEKETEASTAELELLLADETGENKKLKGYNIKRKKSKGKKGEDTADEANLPTVDVDDPRFSALFNNPGFALDPTDPQFKRSATYYRQMAQREQKGSKEEHEDVEPTEPSIRKKDDHSGDTSQRDKHELSAMVKSLKMKSQQLPVQSTVKRKDKTDSNRPTSGKKHKLPNSDRATKKARLQK